jgi:hypothetical protein
MARRGVSLKVDGDRNGLEAVERARSLSALVSTIIVHERERNTVVLDLMQD